MSESKIFRSCYIATQKCLLTSTASDYVQESEVTKIDEAVSVLPGTDEIGILAASSQGKLYLYPAM